MLLWGQRECWMVQRGTSGYAMNSMNDVVRGVWREVFPYGDMIVFP